MPACDRFFLQQVNEGEVAPEVKEDRTPELKGDDQPQADQPDNSNASDAKNDKSNEVLFSFC